LCSTVIIILIKQSAQSLVFELVDTLTSSAQNLVHMICESIACRLPGLSDKSRRQVINPDLYVLRQFIIG
jgi:hypothetical protein